MNIDYLAATFNKNLQKRLFLQALRACLFWSGSVGKGDPFFDLRTLMLSERQGSGYRKWGTGKTKMHGMLTQH